MALLWHSSLQNQKALATVNDGQLRPNNYSYVRKEIVDAFEFAKENVDRHHEWSWFGTTGAQGSAMAQW